MEQGFLDNDSIEGLEAPGKMETYPKVSVITPMTGLQNERTKKGILPTPQAFKMVEEGYMATRSMAGLEDQGIKREDKGQPIPTFQTDPALRMMRAMSNGVPRNLVHDFSMPPPVIRRQDRGEDSSRVKKKSRWDSGKI